VAALLVACLVGTACGRERAEPWITSSDPILAAAAEPILLDLADRAGLTLRGPVRLERRTRPELERYLEFKLDEELDEERAELLSESYGLLGLLPPDFDLRPALKELYLEQVAGFYDPDSTTLFVLADQPESMLESLLVHELVHAIQDQSTDLDAITDRDLGNDRQAAAQAAIEGHATLVMFEFLLEQRQEGAMDLTTIPDLTDQVRSALEAARTQSPAMAAAPLILQESLLFPYLGGAAFVEALWKSEAGRPPPFGVWLPQSTEQVLHPEKFLGGERDAPEELEVSAGAGWRTLYEDTLGELEIGILLETLGGDRAAATGWDGDRYALLVSDQGTRALAWFTVWDSDRSRDSFVRALRPHLPSYPSGTELSPLDVEGLAGARLLIGGDPDVTASIAGR
jgi:hypothetical protein